MVDTDAIVIGAGQAGLAMSQSLAGRGLAHVVLERGRVGERWRSERWDSLRLLTPNWLTRLPGFAYDGPDPDGYMSAAEVAAFLDRYARDNGSTPKSIALVMWGTDTLKTEGAPIGQREWRPPLDLDAWLDIQARHARMPAFYQLFHQITQVGGDARTCHSFNLHTIHNVPLRSICQE